MPELRRLAQHGASIAVASFLVVASSRTAADTPTPGEVAERWKKRLPRDSAEIRQRIRDQQGSVADPAAAPRWRALADSRRGTDIGPAGFHAGGLAVPELTPLNPLFDPLGIFGDETGEEAPIGSLARLFLADFDGDGDLDAFVGDKYGYVRYLENVGTTVDPVYEERTGMASPTGGLDLSEDGDGGDPFGPSAPTLVDIDGDDDLDLFVGQGYEADGRVLFFENDGAGNLTRNDADNPLAGFVFGIGGATPHFVDIDDDGDFDAFVGTMFEDGEGGGSGEVYYAENQGDDENPLFVDQTDVPGVDPFAGLEWGPFTAPFFADIDGDDDLDAFVGGYFEIRFFENQSADTSPTVPVPVLVEQAGAANPLGGNICLLGGPSFGDVDGDGDLDAFVTGGYFKLGYGSVQFFDNTGNSGQPAFLRPGNRLELVDLDRDGDLDVLTTTLTYDDATEETSFEDRYFENTGSPAMPVWTLRTGVDNPFTTFNTGYVAGSYSYGLPTVAPTVGDIDRDGLLDAFVGLPDGTLEYLEDDGTGQLDPAATHPLEALEFGASADPQLVDIDGDGELDLVVGYEQYVPGDGEEGSYFPRVAFFLNPTGPAGLDAPPDLVVDLTDTGIEVPAPSLADIDGDGDLDLYVGGLYSDGGPYTYPVTLFLENTAAAPGGLALDPDAAELVEAFVYPPNAPALGDVNGDGVLDLAIGNLCGVEFFLSEVANLEVTKSITDGPLLPGSTVEYTVTLENVGTTTIEDLAGAELTDVLPAELSLTEATVTSGPGAVMVDTGTNTVTYDGSIPAGGVVTITISAEIAEGTIGDTITNQAVASFDSDGDMVADTMEPSDDPITAEDDDATSFVVLSAPSLEVTKVISGGDLEAGGTVEYTLTIENVGGSDQPDDPANPELTDVLPAELILVAATVTAGPGDVTADPGTNTVRYDGSIPVGETVEITIEATIDAETRGDVVENQAVAFFDTDGDGTNDAEEPSDDPSTAEADDGTTFVVGGLTASVLEIPTLSQWGAVLFGVLLSLAGWLGIRRMG